MRSLPLLFAAIFQFFVNFLVNGANSAHDAQILPDNRYPRRNKGYDKETNNYFFAGFENVVQPITEQKCHDGGNAKDECHFDHEPEGPLAVRFPSFFQLFELVTGRIFRHENIIAHAIREQP